MDNEPTNNLVGDNMEYQWIGCIDHLIELVTSVVFDGKDTKVLMNKIRRVVQHFSSSNQAAYRLKALQTLHYPNKTPLQLIQDVITRWWSTYSMCDRLYELKETLIFMVRSGELENAFDFTEMEWLEIYEIVEILKLFMKLQ